MLFNNPIENVLNSTMSNLKSLSEVENVIGKPIALPDGSTLIPVSKVAIGFLIGGGEYNESSPKKSESFPYATGSGAGINLTPIGFLHISPVGHTFIKTSDARDTWSDVVDTVLKTIQKKDKNEKSTL